MRERFKKDFTHECNTPEEGCQNLINAVFHESYNELVRTIRKAYRMALQAKRETKTFVRWKMEDEAALYMHKVSYLKNWFREVLPIWRDINPQVIINRAYEESGVDFSKLSDGDEP